MIKLSDGTFYPHIPTICYCMRLSCYETCWQSNYKKGHYPARKGTNPWNKDRPWSQEVKDKISISNIGKQSWCKGLTKETDERVRKMSEATSIGRMGIEPWNKDIPCLQETKDKISIANKGKQSQFKGKKHKQSSKRKMSESWEYNKHFNENICDKISLSNKKVIHGEEWNKKVGDIHRGKPLSEDHIKHIIENHGMRGKPRPKGSGTSKGKYYNSSLQGTIWLRSSYEIKCALYLDRNNIPWLYEPKAFPMKIFVNDIEKATTYRPDFLLLKDEIKFIDTKGYLYPESKLKIEKFLKEYPNLKLEIWYREDLQKLGIKVK